MFGYSPMSREILPAPTPLIISNVEFARSFDQLRAAAIKSVLSVGFDLELGEQGFDYLCFPDVVDVDSEVILDLFPKAIAFIEEGFKKGPVLVHCAAGISRSSSMIIAYIMHSQKLQFAEAFAIIRARHSMACPNNFFRRQLEVFGKMQWTVDMDHTLVKKMLRVNMAATNPKGAEFIKDPAAADAIDGAIRCRSCRRLLALPDAIIEHTPGIGERSEVSLISKFVSKPGCTLHFLEPHAWMEGIGNSYNEGGKLLCPNSNCKAKLGAFHWSGSSCSCNAWVTPSFAIHKEKVDVVKNRNSPANSSNGPAAFIQSLIRKPPHQQPPQQQQEQAVTVETASASDTA